MTYGLYKINFQGNTGVTATQFKNNEDKSVRRAPMIRNEVNQSPIKEEKQLENFYKQKENLFSNTLRDQTIRRAKFADFGARAEKTPKSLTDPKNFTLKGRGKELRWSRKYKNGKDFVVIQSKSKIYIAGLFPLHYPTENKTECSDVLNDKAVQDAEAFIWSIGQVNLYDKMLPKTELGALVLDTCGSKRLECNQSFCEDKLSKKTHLSIAKSSLPLIPYQSTSATTRVIQAVFSFGAALTQLFDYLCPSSEGEMCSNLEVYYNSNLNLTNAFETLSNGTKVRYEDITSTCIKDCPSCHREESSFVLLESPHRVYIMAVFDVHSKGENPIDCGPLIKEQGIHNIEALLYSLRELNKNSSLKIGAIVFDSCSSKEKLVNEISNLYKGKLSSSLQRKIPSPKNIVSIITGTQGEVLKQLLDITQPYSITTIATRAKQTFLDDVNKYPRTGSKLIEEGILKLGDFVFVLTKTPRPLFRKEDHALGSLVIQPAVEYFEEFANYMQNLSLSSHVFPYKWFKDYWAEIHKCNGVLCPLKDFGSIDSIRQSEGVFETANAVRIVEKTLKKLKENICQGDSFNSSCIDKILLESKIKFFDTALTMELTGVGGQHLKFLSNGSSTHSTLQVLSFQKSGQERYKFVKIGTYADEMGLLLDKNLAVSYLANGTEIPLGKVSSKCDAILKSCGDLKTLIEFPLMEKNEHQKLVQTHGNVHSVEFQQNLVAAIYALTQIKTKGEIGLGAIAFDYCDRVEKAREQYFNFFSGKMHKSYESLIDKEKIVAAISFDDKAAESVSSILSSNYVPQFSSPVINRKLNHHDDDMILSSVPSRSLEIELYVSIIKTFKWKYVSVIYDNNMMGNKLNEMFRKQVTQDDICISDSLPIPDRLSKEYTKGLVETLSSYWKPKVIVLLVDDSDNIRTLLEVFNEKMLSENFVFLAGSSWGNKLAITEGLERISTGALTFTLETYDLPDFRYFLSNLTLDSHEPIPKSWFEDYYQSKHKCKITNSLNPEEQYVNECTGSETILFDYEVQDPYVYHTILSINSVARGINSYIEKFCNGVKDIERCKFFQPKLLLEITQQGELYMNHSNDIHIYGKESSFGFHLWNYRKLGNSYGYVNIGSFKNDALNLEKSIIEFKVGSFVPESYCNEGICLDICSYQSPVYAIMKMPDPLPVDHNFKTVYGCLMIYSVNFAFIFQATETTCSIRRFLMGFSYAVVYSSMFVKVIHNWRQANYFRNDSSRRNFITITVCSVLIIIEVIVASAWLILYPSQVDLHGELWRCSPSETFEKELVISLIYDMILIASTLLFCFETWHNREAMKQTRWILFSALCTTFTWIIWAVVATQAPIMFRDPSIVIGNIVSATAILLFHFARRYYIYSYLSEDVKNLELKSPFSSRIYNSAFSSSSYLGSHFGKSTTNPIREIIPGTQYVGDQEVSFRTVTLPPNMSQVHRTSSRMSRASKLSPSSVLNSCLEEDPQEDLNINSVFESSEEDYSVDVVPEESDDTSTNSDAASEKNSGVTTEILSMSKPSIKRVGSNRVTTEILSMSKPSIKRVGSNRMLVFLTDGSSGGVYITSSISFYKILNISHNISLGCGKNSLFILSIPIVCLFYQYNFGHFVLQMIIMNTNEALEVLQGKYQEYRR
ncbi:Metabotropic glutamate receptor 3 [Armadillidium vulgare]|nr:Metabotropic glutamate receptor 3 [Armadillidium vulgare]